MGHSSSVQPAASSRSPYFQDIAQALYETAAFPMFVVDESRQILDANAAACQLAGGSVAALQAAALDELRLADGRSLVNVLTETPLANGRKLLIAPADDPAHHPQTTPPLHPKADVLAHSPYGFDVVSAEGKFIYANPAYLRLWGYDSLEEVLGTSPVGHCADPSVPEQIIRNLEVHDEYTLEFTALRNDGTTFQVLMSAQKVVDADGVVTYEGSSMDVTELLLGRQHMIYERQQARALLDAIPDLVWLKDDKGVYQACNPQFEALVGMPEAVVQGKTDRDFFPPEVAEAYRALDHEVIRTGQPKRNEEWATFASDGRTILAETIKTPIYDEAGQLLGVLGIARDITARHHAREALRQSEANLKAIFNNNLQGFVLLDRERRVLAVNSVAAELVEKQGQRPFLAGGPVEELFSPVQLQGFDDAFAQALQGQYSSHQVKIEVAGGPFWYEIHVSPVATDEGQVTGASLSILDITSRKMVEMALQESEARLSGIIDSAMDAIVSLDETQHIVLFNAAAQQMFGYTAEEAMGKSLDLLLPERFRQVHRSHVFDLDQTGETTLNVGWRRALIGQRANGEEFPVEASVSQVTIGEKTLYTAIMRDVTERVQAEQALHDSEERYHAALENMLEGCQIISFDWRYLYLNASVLASSRRTRQEMLGRTMMEVFPGIENTELFAVLSRCMAERTSRLFENKFVYEDDSFAWFNLSVQPVPEGLFILSIDITERKQAEQALRQSEERFAKAFQLSPAALSLTRADGRLVDVNESYERLSGYTREELLGHDAIEFGIFTQEQRDDLRQRMMAQGGSLHEAEIEVRNRSGELRHVLYSVEAIEIGSETYALTLAFDITDRKQLEITLKEMADNMATAQAITRSGSWEIRLAPDGSYIEPHVWSDECYRIFGLEPGSMPITSAEFFSFIHPHDLPEVREVFTTGIAEQRETSAEYRLIRPDGTIRTVFDQVKPMVDERTGQVTKVVGLLQDITEGKRAAATIAQLNRQMELILNSAGEGIYGADVDGRITFINPTMANMLGWDPEDLLGQDAHATFHHTRADGTPYPASECGIRRSLRLGRAFHNVEDTYWSRDGQPVLVDYTCTPIRDGGEILGSVMVVRDITEQRKVVEQQLMLEEQLRQAQKMESIGRLAGGVAHDFNNQLAVIKLYSDLMRYRMAKDDPLLPKLEQIRQAVERATHLTRQLLAFSRKQVLQPVVLDMNELIANLEKMLGRLIGEDIALSTDLQPGLWPITADPGQLEQAIMNLVINARDAMATGGMLTIETRNLIQDETTLALHQDALRGPVVMLAITDTGHGMDEEIRRQIFEPFFTTKVSGKGTGLGLATVHGIVKQSGGTIYVYSEPGQGTTFKIYLPASEGVVTNLEDAAQTAVLQSGHETILLVEDEEALRDLVRLTLEEIGYTLLQAENGVAALALATDYPGVIDLLLTDVVLPQKSGRELAEALAEQRPQTRVLFMSGYMDDAVMRHGVLAAEMNFLSKPFSRSALASKVREVLDKPKP